MSNYKPIGGKLLTKPFMVMMVFAGIAAILLLQRFLFGLGAVTNLSDGYPWGLWIVYDVLTGTTIACGGYAMALLVYVLNKGRYHPLVRPALMTSMFGYTLAGISIFIDVGRYWQIYNILLPKYVNLNSIMFEVAFCVTTYILVLWLEFTPAFLEKWATVKVKAKVEKFIFVFIALGVLLPTMHQSSLGTLMVIAGDKLAALWQTGWLPITFLLSALIIGYGMVIFESYYSSVTFKRPLETHLLAKMSKFIGGVLVLYIISRYGDLIWRGALNDAFAGDVNGWMFIIETILFIIPLFILFSKKLSNNAQYLFWAGVSMVLAGAILRFNTYLVGFSPGPGWHYFPSVSEIMITLGIISAEIMAYLIFVKKLPVLPVVENK